MSFRVMGRTSWSLFAIAALAMAAFSFLPAGVTLAADEPAATAAEADAGAAPAEEKKPLRKDATFDQSIVYVINTLALFICAVLVLFMQAGFAMVESGFNAAKNTVNILYKNAMDVSVGVLLFFVIGFGLMYPGEGNGYLAFGGVGIPEVTENSELGAYSPQADWFFQAAFAAAAATIVSGAVAGRMQFKSYLIYSALLTGLIYPISGYWKWGGGWLDAMGFYDFAGSVVVHAVGGFAGLAGAIVLGPRLGRFVNGKSMAMPGHNLTFAALGVFILWVGWYGFNPGSVLAFGSIGDIDLVVKVAVNTTISAAAGVISATIISWLMFKKPDLSLGLNGALAGLVGITANADLMSNSMSIVVGGVAGILVVLGIILLDKLKIDDPVGAWPVHGLCGMWGCLAIGILPNSGSSGLWVQTVGTVVICGWAFVTMFLVFLALKAMGILRVSPEEENAGLDVSEHGMHAYPSAIQGGTSPAAEHEMVGV